MGKQAEESFAQELITTEYLSLSLSRDAAMNLPPICLPEGFS